MSVIATSTAALPSLAIPPIQRPRSGFTPWIASMSAEHAVSHDDAAAKVDYVFLFDDHKRFIVQVTSAVAASVSLFLVSIAFFWFIRMRKRFRHKLIMLLIFGDWMRALWYLVFATVAFKHGTIYSHTRFCQAAGYLIQMATEISDFSVLFISIHGATQILKPPVSIAGGDDLMYSHRRWVYAFTLIVPQIFASLPFADPTGAGYLSQGAFCTLPLRPIWYRLALAWVPRLAIWITILGLAIAIYTHVRREFSHFSAALRDHSTTSTSFLSETHDEDTRTTGNTNSRSPVHRPSFDPADDITDFTYASADIVARPRPSHIRQISSVDPISEVPSQAFSNLAMTTVAPNGRRNSRVRIEVPTSLVAQDPGAEATNPSSKRKSISESLRSWRDSLKDACDNPNNSHRSSLPNSIDSERQSPGRSSIMAFTAFFNSSRPASDGAKSTTSNRTRSRTFSSTRRAERKRGRRTFDSLEAQMHQKRAHIRRQLRQVFVYPLVYVCMWIVPFVALCLTYNSKLVRRPPFIINTLNNVCLCFMGAANTIVFSMREKPWRHIEGNPSRRFWSSFHVQCGKDDDLEESDGRYRRHSQRRSGTMCDDDHRPAVPQIPRSPTSPPPPPSSLVQPLAPSKTDRDDDDNEHAITPVSPLSPSAAPLPRRPGFTTTTSSNMFPPPPPLTSRTSSPPRPPLLRHASTPPPLPSPLLPGQLPHTTNTLVALSLATAARRSIKRASIMVAASAVAAGETDAQRTAREMAYERLARERREQQQNNTAARLYSATGAGPSIGGVQRRGSTGEIVGGDAGGGGDEVFAVESLGSGLRSGSEAEVVGAREWWEKRGTGWSENGSGGNGGGESPGDHGEGTSP